MSLYLHLQRLRGVFPQATLCFLESSLLSIRTYTIVAKCLLLSRRSTVQSTGRKFDWTRKRFTEKENSLHSISFFYVLYEYIMYLDVEPKQIQIFKLEMMVRRAAVKSVGSNSGQKLLSLSTETVLFSGPSL